MIFQYHPNGSVEEISDIEFVSDDKAIQILETHEPKGLFIHKSEGWYIGIDNSTGDAWTEEFINVDLCVKWLKRKISIEDLEYKGED